MRVSFPFSVRFTNSEPRLVGLTRGAQSSIDGTTSVQASMIGHWEFSCSFWLTNEANTLAFRAFRNGMQGLLGSTLVPFRPKYPVRNRDGLRATHHSVAALGGVAPFEGRGSLTREHFGFVSPPAVTARVMSYAPLRATQIRLRNLDAVGIRPGQGFTIGERYHEALLVWQDGGDDIVEFMPPLRAAVSANSIAVFDAPQCLMRFATDGEGAMDSSIEPAQKITLNFVEAIDGRA